MTVDRTTAPPPAEPRPYHFPHITRTTLPNGLRVLVTENLSLIHLTLPTKA